MRSHETLTVKLMVRKFGETVPHKRRVKVDLGDGEVEYTYDVMEPLRGQFNEIMPYDETMSRFGVKSEADYLGTFIGNADIIEGDQFFYHSIWLEVLNKFEHRTGGAIDYIECLMRKI